MKKRTIYAFIIILAISFQAIGQNKTLLNYCKDYNSLNTAIRDSKISKENALKQIQTLLPKIREMYYKSGGRDYPASAWILPVESYTPKAIGGQNGNGYIPSKYEFFAGNKHTGHPAQDIFISDRNQDCKDDKTGKLVNILSLSGGIVIAAEPNWTETTNLRGGKYIWIYDPGSNNLFYYAHNNELLVNIGEIVKPGSIIARMGRTGMNAFKKRSPTHLHFMQLRLDKSLYPKPYNCFDNLRKAITVK